MSHHDERAFAAHRLAREKHVAALHIALKSAGLAPFVPPPAFISPGGHGVVHNMQVPPSGGYSVERIIEAAQTLRLALAPFDPTTYPAPPAPAP